MDNYILRIYRRKKNDPRIFVGVVEEVGVEGKKAFSNLDELWAILNPRKVKSGHCRKGRENRK